MRYAYGAFAATCLWLAAALPYHHGIDMVLPAVCMAAVAGTCLLITIFPEEF